MQFTGNESLCLGVHSENNEGLVRGYMCRDG